MPSMIFSLSLPIWVIGFVLSDKAVNNVTLAANGEQHNLHESGEYEIVIDRTYLIGLEIQMTEPVVACLAKRHWSFFSAPEGSDFITSDDPAVLTWRDGQSRGVYSPGHGLPDTMVFFPLSPALSLIGIFEDRLESCEYSPSQVTTASTLVARYSNKQIYARNGNFRLNLRDREDIAGEDLVRYYK